ncbi:MAG: hypothetical protein IKP34_02405, partial [Bacteroidales bacterium]|nr:hypothetical protein [Bacteroidales bacterium]
LVVRFKSGQQADIKRTTSGQQPVLVRRKNDPIRAVAGGCNMALTERQNAGWDGAERKPSLCPTLFQGLSLCFGGGGASGIVLRQAGMTGDIPDRG